MMKKKYALLIAAVGIGSVLALMQVFSSGRKPEKTSVAKPPPLVSVTTARVRDLPLAFSAQGHFVPLNQVDVRPQMTGTIQKVHFLEGSEVRAGQLLFTLDPTDAIAQLDRAQAQAAQIQVQLDEAQREYRRAREMVGSGFISSSAADMAASKVGSLDAQFKAARAGVDSARVQVERTRIHSPINGQAGALNVHPGSLAQQNAVQPLVSLVQLDPIGVEFSLPEQVLGALLVARAKNQVTVSIDAPDGHKVAGELNFINNSVNIDSGTIKLKARSPNRNHSLWPGSFARVTLGAGYSKDAVTLPPQAVLEGPKGRFVYVVGDDEKAVSRPVKLLRVQDGEAIVDGVAAGDRVVLEGAQDLHSGMNVRIASPDKAPKGRTSNLAAAASDEARK